MIVVLLVLSLCVCSEQVCFPGEDISECLERKDKTTQSEVEVTERSSLISGRYCFSTRGYSGQCEYRTRCPRSFSYSRTCGWNHVCCKENSRQDSRLDRRPTRPPGGVRRTTRLPVRRAEGEMCGVVVTDLIFCRGARNCTAGRESVSQSVSQL